MAAAPETRALPFAYTIQPGDNISDLQVTGVNLIGGATILDSFNSSLSTSVTADLGVQVITLVTNPRMSEGNLVYPMYQASFAHIPDNAGFGYWSGQADARLLGLTPARSPARSAPRNHVVCAPGARSRGRGDRRD
jgi:hypothetical protein